MLCRYQRFCLSEGQTRQTIRLGYCRILHTWKAYGQCFYRHCIWKNTGWILSACFGTSEKIAAGYWRNSYTKDIEIKNMSLWISKIENHRDTFILTLILQSSLLLLSERLSGENIKKSPFSAAEPDDRFALTDTAIQISSYIQHEPKLYEHLTLNTKVMFGINILASPQIVFSLTTEFGFCYK